MKRETYYCDLCKEEIELTNLNTMAMTFNSILGVVGSSSGCLKDNEVCPNCRKLLYLAYYDERERIITKRKGDK